MSLGLFANSTAMAMNLTQTVSASGGAQPYTYSVLPGGIGGTINSSTGVYTSPDETGIDTLQVVDASGKRASLQMVVGTPLELFCDVIQHEMGLAQGRVYLWDQKLNSPTDEGLFVAVAVVNAKPFGNSNKFDPTLGQIQSVNMHVQLDISIISRGPAARDRKEEIILALNSNYAEQQQELNSFRIFPLSNSFINLSQEDGAAIPYRFNIGCNVQYQVTKTTVVPYFTDFLPVGVTTEP